MDERVTPSLEPVKANADRAGGQILVHVFIARHQQASLQVQRVAGCGKHFEASTKQHGRAVGNRLLTAVVAEAVAQDPCDKILITHGTDTMVETAAEIAKRNIPKTIILTGAMVPYAFGTSSDGFFNLGSALAFAQTLPAGVYVVMNGRYFNWDNVKKNKRTGNFEEII